MDSIECPSCKTEVFPDKRKRPGATDAKDRVGSPVIAFAHFCPISDCNFRLDDAIEAARNTPIDAPDSANVPEKLPIVPTKLQPTKVSPIRPAKDSEDLFSRIRREHDEILAKEAALRSQLSDVVDCREKLERLVIAMEGMRSSIAAE